MNKSKCLKEIIQLPHHLDRRELLAYSRSVIGQTSPLQVQIQAETSAVNFPQVLIGEKLSAALPSLCVLLTSGALTTAWAFPFSQG